MGRPTVVSAIIGAYDHPHPVAKQTVDCDFVLVTDTPHPSWHGLGWDIVAIGQDPNSRFTSKLHKMLPWTHGGDGPWIWVDGRMEICSPTFVAEVTDFDGPLGQWEHPDRQCAIKEAWFSASLPKYKGEPLIEQADAYVHDGHPFDWGLWAAGLIVYQEKLHDFGLAWLEENAKWSIQDQVSEPYVLRKNHLRPTPLTYHLRSNPWVILHPHRDGTS